MKTTPPEPSPWIVSYRINKIWRETGTDAEGYAIGAPRYEALVWRWYCPFWWHCFPGLSYTSQEAAEKAIELHQKRF